MNSSLKAAGESALIWSLRAAAREQGLWDLAQRLHQISDGASRQYTTFQVDTEYLRAKVILQHAFQVDLALKALSPEPKSVVDIGDSSGTHIQYLKALRPDLRADFVSLNLDAAAVAKIKSNGLKAVLGRAEDIASLGIGGEVCLLFETLEHLPDPFNFLHALSSKTDCRKLVLTVPYVRRSRLGLHHIRQDLRNSVSAERVHLLELCPEDLRLLFAHTGWKILHERIYRQYPLRSPLRATRAVWARWDFEGFYGAVLERDHSWSSLYESWN